MSSPFPEAFLTETKSLRGNEQQHLLEALEEPASLSIRLNPGKFKRKLALPHVPWSSQGYYLDKRPEFVFDPWWHAGAYYVQEASSMFLEHAWKSCVDTDAPLRVLDLCAAPGGKSTLLASLLPKGSVLIANEVIRPRANILHENLTKWGYPHVFVTQNDPADFQALRGCFDVIVVDAPCSGEGLFRKEPEWRSEWSPEQVELCSARQKRILQDVWPALKEGGLLLYSTCTFNRQENEENLRWLAQQDKATSQRIPLNGWDGITETETEGWYGYRFYPDRVQGEGFFLAAMRKTETEREFRFPKASKRSVQTCPDAEVSPYLQEDHPFERFVWDQEQLIGLLPDTDRWISLLQKHFRLLPVLTHFFDRKKAHWIPTHALAMSIHADLSAYAHPVNLDDALRFLHKAPVSIPGSTKGWYSPQYEGLPLGWLRWLGNRGNNAYPKHYRLRKAPEQANPGGTWWS